MIENPNPVPCDADGCECDATVFEESNGATIALCESCANEDPTLCGDGVHPTACDDCQRSYGPYVTCDHGEAS